MSNEPHAHLTRRERQIMDVLLRRGRAATAEIQEEIPDPPSYSAVRAALRVLADKGHVTYTRQSHHYVYEPTISRTRAQRDAARRLLSTFFEGSASKAVAALLDAAEEIPEDEIEQLGELIEAARREGR